MDFEFKLRSSLDQDRVVTDCIGDDCCSEILAGNIFEQVDEVCDTSLEGFSEDDGDTIEDSSDINDDIQEFTMEDIDNAEKVFEEKLGITNMLRSLAKLVLAKKILPTDILIQALCYKIQSTLKGKQSVRYLDSYGMYWAGVRNLLKTRGEVHVCFDFYSVYLI